METNPGISGFSDLLLSKIFSLLEDWDRIRVARVSRKFRKVILFIHSMEYLIFMNKYRYLCNVFCKMAVSKKLFLMAFMDDYHIPEIIPIDIWLKSEPDIIRCIIFRISKKTPGGIYSELLWDIMIGNSTGIARFDYPIQSACCCVVFNRFGLLSEFLKNRIFYNACKGSLEIVSLLSKKSIQIFESEKIDKDSLLEINSILKIIFPKYGPAYKESVCTPGDSKTDILSNK